MPFHNFLVSVRTKSKPAHKEKQVVNNLEIVVFTPLFFCALSTSGLADAWIGTMTLEFADYTFQSSGQLSVM